MDDTFVAAAAKVEVTESTSESDANLTGSQFPIKFLFAFALLVACWLWFSRSANSQFDEDPGAIVFPGLLLLAPPILGTIGSKGFHWRHWVMVPYLLLLLFTLVNTNWYLGSFSFMALGVFFLGHKRIGLNGSLTRITGVLAAILVVATLTGHLLNALAPPPRLRALQMTRLKFPLRDLSKRMPSHQLAETYPVVAPRSDIHKYFDFVDLSTQFESARGKRNDWLAKLHDREYYRFTRSLGFGVGRMTPPTASELALTTPPIEDIPFSGDFQTALEKSMSQNHNAGNIRTLVGSNLGQNSLNNKQMSLSQSLIRSYVDFLNPNTFGYIREFRVAAGFQPHAFRFKFPRVEHRSESYELRRLELVSLLCFDTPRVYVLDHLPRMDQLSQKGVPTRELNSFEKVSLDQLKLGEMVVVDESDDGIQMLGAVRALGDCLQCHVAKPTQLLGAFSYELARTSPIK